MQCEYTGKRCDAEHCELDFGDLQLLRTIKKAVDKGHNAEVKKQNGQYVVYEVKKQKM
jgi:hypothetical protein